MNSKSPAPITKSGRPDPNQQRPSWLLVVQWFVVLMILTVLATIVGIIGVLLLCLTTGLPLARYAFEVPGVALLVVWIVGVVTAWRKHHSITLVGSLAVIGVVGYLIAPFMTYLVVILFVGGMRDH